MNQKWYWAIPISLFLIFNVYSEVTVDFGTSDNKSIQIEWQNNSLNSYYLGGCRFFTNSYTFSFNNTYWNYSNIDKAGNKEHTLLYANKTSPVKEVPALNGSYSVSSNTDWSGKTVEIPFNSSILLKTGSSGMIDQPEDEDPITIEQIDSLLNTPNFYNPDHRYIDTLGSNGGIYSGGIMDTWLGETQVITHFSNDTWTLHTSEQASFDLSKTNGDPIYWMSVIMGQEYFQVDMQWMLGKGAQETGAGAGAYNGTNAEGAYGPWEVEVGTGTSREGAYPYLFQNGTISDFWNETYAQIDEALVVNGYIYSIAAVRYMYDFLMYAEDACWKEILTSSQSRYYPISILLGGYNNGIGDMQNVLDPFWHVNSYEPYSQDPNAHNDVEAAMNKGYVPGVIGGVENLENGSKAAAADLSLPLVDMDLSLVDIKRFFYGEGGTATSQGVGGLLAHFDVNRTQFNTLIEAAFSKLKGKAPSTTGKDAISLRYDFLTLLRVVKTNFQISWTRPNGPDEWNIAVSSHSKTGGCSGVTFDNEYPYAELATPVTGGDGSDFHIEVHAWDNVEIEKVTWTINPNWQTWHNANHKSGSGADQIFEFNVTEAQKNAIDPVQTIPFWYLATDINGNSVLGKGLLEGAKYPTLKGASAIDTSGDGKADYVHVSIQKSAHGEAYDLDECDQFTYSWSSKSNHQTVTDSIILTDSAIHIHNLYDNNGAGLGEILINYQDMQSPATTDIEDKVGPAIQKGNATYKLNSNGDTLKLKFTEPLNTLSGTEYFLAFKNNSIDSQEVEILSVNGAILDWNFVFTNLALSNYDSVKIVSYSSLTDTVNNQAANNNQWVSIKKLGSNDPTWDIAYIEDTNGNGDGDKLTIKINLGDGPNPISMSDVQEVKFTWPNGNTMQTISSVSAQNNTTLVIDISEISGEGLGILDSIKFGSSSLTGNTINDSVSPVIDAASYNIKSVGDASNDTLHLTLSESLKGTLTDGQAYINLKQGNGPSTKVSSIQAINISNNNWIFILAPGSVGDNDSVNLTTNSGLEDNYGNSPDILNQWVFINKSGGKIPNLNIAHIKDEDGDGYGDHIYYSILKGKADNAFTLDDCDSLKFKWPENGILKTETFGFSGLEDTINSNIDEAGNGYGELILFFNDSDSLISLQTTITDSIGPAISEAFYKENSNEPCSLQIVFTEPITNNLKDNTAYLNLKKKNGSKISVVSSTAIPIGSDGLTWKFIFPSGTINEGDSVNLISSSGLIDQAFLGDNNNNKPHPENQMVKIEIESELYTLNLNKSEYLDTNANGIMDKIILAFNGKSVTDSILAQMKFLIEWPDINENNIIMEVNGNQFTNNGQTISWNVSGYNLQKDLTIVTDSSNYGGVIIIQPKDDSNNSIDTSDKYIGLQDKMAPVLISAEYFINNTGDGKDSLFITFSEPIEDYIASSEPFIFNKGEYQIPLNLEIVGKWAPLQSMVFVNKSETIPNNGDSLNINPLATILGSVVQNNPQNKHVKLTINREVTIQRVEYYDTDNRPDGRIDKIKFITDTTVSQELLVKLVDIISLPSHRQFNQISSSNFISLAPEKGFEITVSQNLPLNSLGWAGVSTNTSNADSINLNGKITAEGFMFRPEKYTAIDSIAPVIKAAYFHPAYIDKNNYLDNVPDTVTIAFSEKVSDINNLEPFNFIVNGITVAMTLSDSGFIQSDSIYRFIITDNKDAIIMEDDSVQIDDQANISDQKSISQDKDTYPVPFTIGDYQYAYRRIVYPNPLFRSSESQLQEKKEAFVKIGIPEDEATSSSIAIIVQPYGWVLNSEEIKASITIFDMVGNRLVNNQKLEFKETDNKQVWYYIWDTQNIKKRSVGTGVYLGVITMSDKESTDKSFKVRIGVGE